VEAVFAGWENPNGGGKKRGGGIGETESAKVSVYSKYNRQTRQEYTASRGGKKSVGKLNEGKERVLENMKGREG